MQERRQKGANSRQTKREWKDVKCSEQRGQSKFLPSRGYNHHSHKTGFTFLDVIDILWQWQVNKYICWKTWWIFILLTALNCHLVTGPIHVSELVAAQACRPPTSPTWWPTDILRKVSIENWSIEKLQSDDEAFLDRLINIMVQGVHWGLVIGYIPNILQDYRQDESDLQSPPLPQSSRCSQMCKVCKFQWKGLWGNILT